MAGYIVKQIFLCQKIFIMLLKIVGSCRSDYEYEIEYEYDFRISNQRRFQNPHSSYWF